LLVEPVSFPVPDNDEVILSAKNPSRFEEPKPSGLSIDELGRTLRLVSWSLEEFRKRVVAGVWRGVASLEVRLLLSVPSSGEEERLMDFTS